MNYPTIDEVERADKLQLATWYRRLPSPTNDAQVQVIDRIVHRFQDMGGWTPELSKQVGWD